MEGRDCLKVVGGLKHLAGMVLAQMIFAGMNILHKLALNDDMDVSILVSYRYILATAFLFPVAFLLERKSRPGLTWRVVMLSFVCALFGGPLSQMLYIESMKRTSPTFVSAMTNLTTAITFILAVIFRLESLEIKKAGGQAKSIGILLGLSGAMLLTFYKGPEFNLSLTSINLLKSSDHRESRRQVMGLVLAAASCLCNAISLIIQANLTELYPCHLSNVALTCMMSAVQAVVYSVSTVSTQRHAKEWRIGLDIRVISVAFDGIVVSGLIFPLMSWCIKEKGPLYASAFNPLVLVIVALTSSVFLGEPLHLGSIIGAIIIVIGLFLVLWGKKRGGRVHGEIQLQDTIEKTHLSIEGRSQNDKLIWKGNRTGTFSSKSASLTKGSWEASSFSGTSSTLWEKICRRSSVSPSVQVFIWRAIVGALPAFDPQCHLCGMEVESVDHLLWNCTFANVVWFSCRLGIRSDQLQFRFDETINFMADNLSQEDFDYFLTTAWYLWKARNKIVFEGGKLSPMDVGRNSDRWEAEIKMLKNEEEFCMEEV